MAQAKEQGKDVIGEVPNGNGQALPVKATPAAAEPSPEQLLTRAERKVLDGLLNPDLRNMTQREFCKAIGVSRTVYWNAMQKPHVQQARRDAIRTHVQRRALAFIEAAAQTAATPGRDGFQDRRLLLSLTGDHVERRQHQHEINARVLVGVVGVDMAELG